MESKILMGGVIWGSLGYAPPPSVKPKRNPKSKVYQLSSAQKELARIYKRLHEDCGMTQLVLAAKLNIGSARLASYLYGRTSGVPDRVMDAARAIANAPDRVKNQFEGKKMPFILKRWAKTLGLPAPDDAFIASTIGVNVSTVCRWRIGDTKPSNVELISYDARITRAALQMKRALVTT